MANNSTKNPKVAVVGGGIAGLTAALKLAQRDYDVTLFEATDVLGGNLSSRRDELSECAAPKAADAGGNGVYHDVYPHMFSDWYKNFWALLKTDLGLERDKCFEARDSVKLLSKGSEQYQDLRNPSDLRSILANLCSGVYPAADMFLYGYGVIDLAAQKFDPRLMLNRINVDGFLYSQYYSTENVAQLFNMVLSEIWAIRGSQTSAMAYKNFLRPTVTFPHHAPFAWMLKGSLEQMLIAPFEAKLKELGCEIELNSWVNSVGLHKHKIKLGVTELDDKPRSHEVDYVVLAVPPAALDQLIRAGGDGERVVDKLPHMAEVRRLRAEPIPVVNLYFKRKLSNIPREHIALRGSPSDLSVIDISQLWVDDPSMSDRTAVVVAASNVYAFTQRSAEEEGFAMIQEYHEYWPNFKLGKQWGDPDSDIDWLSTNYQTNDQHKLFINQVGTVPLSPAANYEELPNVFFAGDYCENEVSMATVEGAVITGLEAAKALTKAAGQGRPVEVAALTAYSDSTLLAFKLALAPTAYGAKCVSAIRAVGPQVRDGDLAGAATSVAKMAKLPAAYAVDVLDTGCNLLASLLSKKPRRRA